MGVKGVTGLLKELAPNAIKEVSYNSFAGQTVAIDVMLIIYKFMISILNTGGQLTRSDGKVTTHLNGFLYKIKNLLTTGIFPIFVIDGKSPDIKRKTIKKRGEKREKALNELEDLEELDDLKIIQLQKKAFRPSNEIISDVKKLITLFGLPLIQASGEADPQCAALNKSGIVDYVISEDIDTIFFGAPKMVKNFSTKKKAVVISLDKILVDLDLTYDQFIELGVLMGCDYCISTISGLRGKNIYNKYKHYGKSIESLIIGLEQENKIRLSENKKPLYNIPEEFRNTWKDAKEYYLNTEVYNPTEELDLKWNKPDYIGILDFLVRDNQFNKNKVINIINEVMSAYKYYTKYNKLNNNTKYTPEKTLFNKKKILFTKKKSMKKK